MDPFSRIQEGVHPSLSTEEDSETGDRTGRKEVLLHVADEAREAASERSFAGEMMLHF